jgi:hypothetical protein
MNQPSIFPFNFDIVQNIWPIGLSREIEGNTHGIVWFIYVLVGRTIGIWHFGNRTRRAFILMVFDRVAKPIRKMKSSESKIGIFRG